MNQLPTNLLPSRHVRIQLLLLMAACLLSGCGTPGGTMAGDRLKTLTELLANVASLSNEDLNKILNATHRVERQ